MPRTHRRKTTRWINEDCMQSAVRDICAGIETPSTAARKYGLKRTTIIYRVEKKQKLDQARGNGADVKFPPMLTEIFSAKQEKELMEFLNRYTFLPYDTSSSYKAARQLVYRFVKTHDIKHPKIWDIEQQASVDWLKGFIQRNPETNLKKPLNDSPKHEDEATSNDSRDVKLPFVTQIHETDPDATAAAEFPSESKCKTIASSERSLESDISQTYSFSHFMESNHPVALQQLTQQHNNHHPQPDSCEDIDDISELDLEPECNIIVPTIVSVKQESETDRPNERPENKANVSGLDVIPVDDDVFNSFGRNVAFQVKELYRLSQLEAYELMHEIQSTANKRLTDKLRLKRARKEQNSIKTSAVLLPQVIQIDDDDDVY